MCRKSYINLKEDFNCGRKSSKDNFPKIPIPWLFMTQFWYCCDQTLHRDISLQIRSSDLKMGDYPEF